MAPALTETATDGHGIHLSSPLGSSGIDLDGSLLGMELDPQQKLMEDDCSQTAWLNLTFLPSPDACSKDALELQTPFLSPLVQSSGSYRTMLQSSPGTLLNLLSLNRSLASPVLPCSQGLEAYILSGPEPGGQGAARAIRGASPKPPLPKERCLRGAEPLAHSLLLTSPWVKGERELGWPQTQAQPKSAEPKQTALVRTQLCRSRQHALLGQAARVQKRLQALLGEHALRHCGLQLGRLTEALSGDRSLPWSRSPTESKPFHTPVGLEMDEEGALWSSLAFSPPPQKVPSPLQKSADIRTFVCSARAVVGGVRNALDSDATDSSSDEEWDIEGAQGSNCLPVWQGREWKWWSERAEIGSRWTWLQVRVSELEFRIQQLSDLQRQISSTKGGVVLAETPSGRSHQALLAGERGDCDSRDFTSDPELEPSSPTRLLRNIEKQSAQLTRIVNSLMPPFGFSPSSSPTSKPPCRWKGRSKRSLSSDQCFPANLLPGQGGVKRRRVCRRRPKLAQQDSTCVAARTRPLLTYHKPRLFTLDPPTCLHRRQGQVTIPSCDPCDPPAAHAHPSQASDRTSRGWCGEVERMRPHPVISLTSETPLPVLLQSALCREDWVQRAASVKTEDPGPCRCPSFGGKEHHFPALFGCGHTEVHHGKRSRRACGVGSPVRWTPAAQGCPRRAWRGGRKRQHSDWRAEDGDVFLSNYCLPPTPEDSPPDLMTPRSNQTHKQPSQSFARRRLRGECFYDIDDIVIPMSLAVSSKVEQLQYKNILTPSWRIINMLPLEEREGGGDEVEVLLDGAFSRRHQVGEHRERLCWSSWARGRGRRRSRRGVISPCRSSSSKAGSILDVAPSAKGCAALSSLAAQVDWDCVHPAADTEDSFQECAFLLPWERRTFPLSEEDEEALKPEEDSLASLRSDSEGTEFCSTDTCSEHSLSGTDCCATALSAGGMRQNMLMANMGN
ncbi:KAT8 regulatory NSL complex subunit 1-like protein isoform X1 [Anguilla rostrata]|uniref:KAT8 regulatory NSL complex subunit 1-like protein isoform X1 n=1 Tax=Anguilla rostrata TaxID=7938 RepID=UPI0030CF7242